MGVDYNQDGTRIATVSQDGSARLWNAVTGEELLQLKPEGGAGLVDIAFSSDGKMLAISADDAVKVYLLEIDDLVDLAKSRLSRNFSLQECLKFFTDARCEKLVEPTLTAESVTPVGAARNICLMSDPLGITKFNIHYWPYLGVVEAADRHGWEWQVLMQEGYETMSESFERALGSDCELIVALGWIVEDIISEYHFQHPDQKFLLLDYSYDPPLENIWSSWSAADQGGFLAGYLAAAMSQTGVIGTFGSVNTPAVTDFMTGFETGMHYYNRKYDARVQLVGWDSENNEGMFIGGFVDPDGGYQFTQSLLKRGADIIFPAGGIPTNYGALLAIMEGQQTYVIGLDVDYKQIFPEFGEIILTSVLKRFDQSVLRAADSIAAGNFKEGTYLGTLETGELDLAPFYELEAIVPAQIKADLEQIKADIIAGKIQTKPQE
jgi:basic membrane protein A